jgi:hypothetical protein
MFPSFFQKTVGAGDPFGGAQSNLALPPSNTPTSDGSRRNLSFRTEIKGAVFSFYLVSKND